MVTAPVIALPNPEKLFVVETEASGARIGAVLMQFGHPIAYLKQKLTKPTQQAWMAKLLQFDYEICYCKGKENYVADGLSWIPSLSSYAIIVSTLTSELLSQLQSSWDSDLVLQAIIADKQIDPASHSKYTEHLN
ncbi:hypothetical protein GH714_041860 [Hevea brasiliensis]|uniref:Reverse transcriptase/retrotransposon-derived protein RNase H-like domain-containing protein n=1 Tax=Hevea brasiliensis TaxID=3981 RepID=A0A6A6MXA4_HEVBR|nr:hypothetical protein GH714_041860 [Hevea brasiliensis]